MPFVPDPGIKGTSRPGMGTMVTPDALEPMPESLAGASGGSVRRGAAQLETPGGKENR